MLLNDNGKRNPVLVVVAFFKEYDLLGEHLSLLKAQEDRSFDVVVVIDPASDAKQVMEIALKSGMAPIIARMDEPLGAAGAFFCGEKLALERGYGAVVYADIDALPVGTDVMGKLISAWRGGALLATPRCELPFMARVLEVGRGGGHYYGLVDCSLLGRYGLHYVPMFIGGDDAEFFWRVCAHDKMQVIDARITHPLSQSLFANFERSALYRINIATTLPTAGGITHLFAFVLLPYLIFGTRRARNLAMHILSCLLRGRFGKDAMLAPVKEQETDEAELALAPLQIEGKETVVLDYLKPRPGSVVSAMGKIMGRNIIIYPLKNYVVGLAILFSKEAWIYSKGGNYRISRSGPLHLLKMALYFLLLPLAVVSGLLMFMLKKLTRPEALRYGLK